MARRILWQDAPEFSQEIEILGKLYRLTHKWNDFAGCWTLDIAKVGGEPIIYGLKLVENWEVLAKSLYMSDLPQIRLVVISDGPIEYGSFIEGSARLLFEAL